MPYIPQKKTPSNTIKRQRGVVLVMTVIALLALLAVTGMALDGGHVLLTQTRMQNLVDTAALSGAKTLQQTDNTSQATADAIATFNRSTTGENASAPGYGSIKKDLDSGDLTLSIEFSKTLDPFVNGTTPAVYIRVTASPVTLSTSLLRVLNISTLKTNASAVSGPTPSLVKNVCDIAPFMMCGDDDTLDGVDDNGDDKIYGYTYDEPTVIKIGAGQDPEVGSGNFQLIQVGGPGGSDVRDAAAGVESVFCLSTGDDVEIKPVETKTGNTVGPVVQGLNTRFGEYLGAAKQYDETEFPGDHYSTDANPPLSLDVDGNLIVIDELGNTVSVNDNGTTYINVDDTDPSTGVDLKLQEGYHAKYLENYEEYTDTSEHNFQRRLITVPVGKCAEPQNGQHSADIWGFACVYLTQKAIQKGPDAHVFAQVVKGCTNPGGFSVNPVSGPEPTTIVLHKNPNDKRS